MGIPPNILNMAKEAVTWARENPDQAIGAVQTVASLIPQRNNDTEQLEADRGSLEASYRRSSSELSDRELLEESYRRSPAEEPKKGGMGDGLIAVAGFVGDAANTFSAIPVIGEAGAAVRGFTGAVKTGGHLLNGDFEGAVGEVKETLVNVTIDAVPMGRDAAMLAGVAGIDVAKKMAGTEENNSVDLKRNMEFDVEDVSRGEVHATSGGHKHRTTGHNGHE